MTLAVVSGHLGFIGRHIASKLQNYGYNLFGFDIKSSGVDGTGIDAIDWFRHPDSDALDVDIMVHCAAVVGGRSNIDGNPLAIAQNFSIDAECIQWAIRNKPRKLILFSSSAAYPIALQTKTSPHEQLKESDISLNDVRTPDSLYGMSKVTLEMQAIKAREAGIDVIIVRPFSGWGLDQDDTYPMPSFIQRAMNRVERFDIWGDGEQIRDWIHVDDICNALTTMLQFDIGGPVNLCSGIATSFNDLAKMVCEIEGYEPEFNRITDAPVGVHHRVGDPTMFNQFYKPRLSLQERLERVMKP